MKILILANNDVGLYQFRRELIGALLKDHEVWISLPNGGLVEPLVALGCHFVDTPIDRRGMNPVADMKLLRRYQRMLKQVKPDLVITYTIKPNVYGGLACRLAGIPYAANITGLGTAFQKKGPLRTLVTGMYRTALKKAKVAFFENSANLALFVSGNIVKQEKTCLLSGAGVNLQHYSCAPYPDEESPVRFLFVGRVMREKGIEELLSAMERLQAKGAKCTLDVLGGCEERYEETFRSHEAAGWLRYHGYQQNVRPFIMNAHCFVLPSWHEGMANTNLECAAMGRPVITSDIPGCREAVLPGVSGLLCKAGDGESLYEAMSAFIRLPNGQRAEMGRAGRAHMEAVFDKEIVVEKTIQELNLN